ncbi:MAG: sigma-E processing peptidase SpoIIGA, partial [Clostridia bacterium]|nr:sigma-E processing peptidase SpoIIGA [Clostridia bacterium]
MILYVDVLLAVNWVIDFLLLHALARLLRIPCRRWRLVCGSAVGAAACAVVLLPPLPAWISVLFKAVTALLMVATAFGLRAWREWLRRTVVLFVLSAAVAGVALAVWWLAAPPGLAVVNGVVYYDVPPLLLIGCMVGAYGLLCLYARWTRRRAPVGQHFRLRVGFAGQTVEIPALYDSGNALAEPFSGSPVAVADYAAVAALLTPAWSPEQTAPPPGARLIPFSSVGGRGVMPAFCPDRLTVM